MEIVKISQICRQLYIIIIFSLQIFVNLKDKLWFAIIKKGFFNKKLSVNLKSDTGSSTTSNNYKKKEIETILGFIDKDRLVCTA